MLKLFQQFPLHSFLFYITPFEDYKECEAVISSSMRGKLPLFWDVVIIKRDSLSANQTYFHYFTAFMMRPREQLEPDNSDEMSLSLTYLVFLMFSLSALP